MKKGGYPRIAAVQDLFDKARNGVDGAKWLASLFVVSRTSGSGESTIANTNDIIEHYGTGSGNQVRI